MAAPQETPVDVLTQWMQAAGRLLLRNAIDLQAEFGCEGCIPPDQSTKVERLIEACKDVLRAECQWHGSAGISMLVGSE